jgi:hypothetical protein
MAVLSNIITPSNVLTATNTQTVTNKDLTSGTNTFPSSLATLTGTQTLTNKTLTSPVINNDLAFTGTGNRITGDFSNATLASRVYAQTNGTNLGTSFGVIPNGTGANAAYNALANSDPTNTSYGQFRVGTDTGDVRITSGVVGTGSYLPVTFYTGGSERLRIDTSGNVGIGTSSPQAKLAVSNAGAAGLEFFTNYPGGGVGTYIQSFNRSAVAYSNIAYDAAAHAFFTSGTERMRIDSSGNVGIGKTNPQALLDYRETINVISTNTTAVASRTYVFTATLTLTLPSSPTAGDFVMFSNRSATSTPVIGRNGSNIMGLAEDMTVDNVNYFGTLVYADATRGWIFQ